MNSAGSQPCTARLSAGAAPRLIEVIETEALSLHEGNIARYRIRPGEYAAWHARWA